MDYMDFGVIVLRIKFVNLEIWNKLLIWSVHSQSSYFITVKELNVICTSVRVYIGWLFCT